jgi:hypothetical protein
MGYRVDLLEGRVSTPIQAFDRASMTVKTLSGRTYRLEGPPGLDADALYVWNGYAAVNQLKLARDVTGEYYEGWQGIDRLIDSRGEMVAAAMKGDSGKRAQEEAERPPDS